MTTQYRITGQAVTLEHDGRSWIATGWQQGLPVARRPIPADQARALLERFPHVQRTY